MATKKAKVWKLGDVKRAVEGLFIPGERRDLLDAYIAMADLVQRGKRPAKDLREIQATEWRLIPLPDHAPIMAARLRVTTTRMNNLFTVVEVRGDGWHGEANGSWYDAVAQEINRGQRPVENPARRPRKRTRP